MRVSGTDLELDVGLDSGDYSFPILVDPVIEDYDWGSGASCPSQGTPSATYWHWETSNTSSWGAGCNSATTSGLLNQARASQLFLANAYAQWVWRPPAGTYISSATYDGVRHVSGGGSCLGAIQLLMPNNVVTTAAAQEWAPHASFTLGDSHDPTVTSHPTPTGTGPATAPKPIRRPSDVSGRCAAHRCSSFTGSRTCRGQTRRCLERLASRRMRHSGGWPQTKRPNAADSPSPVGPGTPGPAGAHGRGPPR